MLGKLFVAFVALSLILVVGASVIVDNMPVRPAVAAAPPENPVAWTNPPAPLPAPLGTYVDSVASWLRRGAREFAFYISCQADEQNVTRVLENVSRGQGAGYEFNAVMVINDSTEPGRLTQDGKLIISFRVDCPAN